MSGLRLWGRRVALVAVATGLGVGAAYAPVGLRRVDALRVQQVEVTGTRFLDPYAVVRAAGLNGASMVDDADRWVAGVRTLALVEDVRVSRTFPSRVTVEVRESVPVALVSTETLRPVDASGRLLELEPAGAVLDLPILLGVTVRNGGLAKGPSASAARTLAELRRVAPGLAERVSHVELMGSSLRVAFREEGAEAVLPAAATRVQLTQLRLALADLESRGELDQVRTIDVRFRDQVVVSFLGRAVS